VIYEFQQWLLKDWPKGRTDKGEGLQFWSKPAHFDHPFLASYFKMFNLDFPCLYRYARDMNSFIAGRSGSPCHPTIEDEIDFDGPAHDALFDTIKQVKVLLEAKNRWPQCEILPPETVPEAQAA
jgi:hypothetical protein